MITLKKTAGRDEFILNLSDPQLTVADWSDEKGKLLCRTVESLVKEHKPILITLTGDLGYAEDLDSYGLLADFIDSFDIPWAPIWGNHDNQAGPEQVDKIADMFLKHKNCVYEKGEKILGNGNYVVAFEEEGKIVSAAILMDTHDRQDYLLPDGSTHWGWASLNGAQIDWYKKQCAKLSDLGCDNNVLFIHIPIFAYKQAVEASIPKEVLDRHISYKESFNEDNWNEGYKHSHGIVHEGISCGLTDDGVFDIIKATGKTTHIVCGHNHINNAIIKYKGITLAFAMKLGWGSYGEREFNGGTLIRVTSGGIGEVEHHILDPKELLSKE